METKSSSGDSVSEKVSAASDWAFAAGRFCALPRPDESVLAGKGGDSDAVIVIMT